MVTDFIEIDERTIERIKAQQGGDATRVIDLIKHVERTAEEESGDPFLVAMADRARALQDAWEDRQKSTQEALADLMHHIEADRERQRKQAELGLKDITYFMPETFLAEDIPNAPQVASRAGQAFGDHPYRRISEPQMREVRREVALAIFGEEDDYDRVARIVDDLFNVLKARNR